MSLPGKDGHVINWSEYPGRYIHGTEMRNLLSTIEKYAGEESRILLRGEPGTGRLCLAGYFHEYGPAPGKPFLAVDCTTIAQAHQGNDCAADPSDPDTFRTLARRVTGGTLCLADIHTLPGDVQEEIVPILRKGLVNWHEDIGKGFRVAATVPDKLEQLVDDGVFNRELFYLLKTASVFIPPLREQDVDVPALVRSLVDEFNRKYNRDVQEISPEALDLLGKYDWPGNFRELRHLVEMLVLQASGPLMTSRLLHNLGLGTASGSEKKTQFSITFDTSENVLEDMQVRVISRALEIADYNQVHTARLLGIPRTTLQYYLRKYDLY